MTYWYSTPNTAAYGTVTDTLNSTETHLKVCSMVHFHMIVLVQYYRLSFLIFFPSCFRLEQQTTNILIGSFFIAGFQSMQIDILEFFPILSSNGRREFAQPSST